MESPFILPIHGYTFEKFLGYLSLEPIDGTKPLYGCSYNGDRYPTTKSYCGSATFEVILGYIFVEPVENSVAMYLCHTNDRSDFYPSTDNFCDGAGNNGGILGYVLR